jgi:hypothetical protein
VFENVRILQHLEIPDRGMYVSCKYYEDVIEIGNLQEYEEAIFLLMGQLFTTIKIYRVFPKIVPVLIVLNC